MDPSSLRAEFPVLANLVYLNAGTDGPLPGRAVQAARTELERAANDGRAQAHFEHRAQLTAALRAAFANLLGCPAEDVSLTSCTSEGIALVLSGLPLRPGEEILTSDEEHPGLLGALAAARDIQGVAIRTAPLAEIARSVGPATRLVACSHVGWMSGSLAPPELAELQIPVLLDGAQGVGAIPVDVQDLGCSAYAGPGQKWLCGPDGTGMLYVRPDLRERIEVSRRGYANLADPGAGLHSGLHEDGRRLDCMSLSAETLACGLASIELLTAAGWSEIHDRASSLAGRLAEMLQEQGRPVGPRGQSTLVAFQSPDPAAERDRLAERGIVLRDIPGRPWLRASVGAWNDETDLDQLVASLADL